MVNTFIGSKCKFFVPIIKHLKLISLLLDFLLRLKVTSGHSSFNVLCIILSQLGREIIKEPSPDKIGAVFTMNSVSRVSVNDSVSDPLSDHMINDIVSLH